MFWHEGTISEAVQLAKSKNAIFAVFVKGNDASSLNFLNFINEDRISCKLSPEDFVAIQVESGSTAYAQFVEIYHIVPVPSFFFIDQTGVPMNIIAGAIVSIDELERRIDEMLIISGKAARVAKTPTATPADMGEGATAADASSLSTSLSSTSHNSDQLQSEPPLLNTEQRESPDAVKSGLSAEAENADAAQVAERRKQIQKQREEQIALEREQKAKERDRRHRQMSNTQPWQKDQELRALQEKLIRDRRSEQEARERIRAQIAGDRAEHSRRHRAAAEASSLAKKGDADAATAAPGIAPGTGETGGIVTSNTSLGSIRIAPISASSATSQFRSSNATRLQFRLANGIGQTHTFDNNVTLGVVRDFVRSELLSASNVREFTLATTYPKREFSDENYEQTLHMLNLWPSAVILVIVKELTTPRAIISHTSGLFGMLNTVVWALLTPVFTAFNYFRNMLSGEGRGGNPAGRTGPNVASGSVNIAGSDPGSSPQTGLRRRHLEDSPVLPGASSFNAPDTSGASPGQSFANRRDQKSYSGSNIHRLTDNRKDSDDENATWNGNSTQQQ